MAATTDAFLQDWSRFIDYAHPTLVPNVTGPFQGLLTSGNIGGSGSTMATQAWFP